jgi:asparagine N-glycosylation enzyme membrane subunit Stt3
VSRLYFGDGAGARAGSIGGMRLVWEGESTSPDHPLHEERFKLFELVPGAELRVSGAAPGAQVTATVPVLTNTGRTFTWSTRRTADREGSAALRIPYATGPNATVRAGACVVSDGARSVSATVPAGAVATAGAVAVSLAPAYTRR